MLLDLQLKTGSGANVIRAVRADPGLATTRLLVTSNHTSPQLKAGCMELGPTALLRQGEELRCAPPARLGRAGAGVTRAP